MNDEGEAVQDGPFVRYHPDGQVARRGTIAGGAVDGVVIAFASDGDGAEPLRSCCVPPGARRMEAKYIKGNLQEEVFFDGQGRRLLTDGTLYPERPATVPATAKFSEHDRMWKDGLASPETYEPTGTWRTWREDGSLAEVAEYENGLRSRVRLHDAAGTLCEDACFDGGEKRHGPYWRRWVQGEPGCFADARVREEQGAFEHGQAVGRWSFRDGGGQEVAVVDRGVAFDAAAVGDLAALGDGKKTSAAWLALAGQLRADHRVREALCAAARAAAAARSPHDLARLLGDLTLPLALAASGQRVDELAGAQESDLAPVLDALVCGADPAFVFRTVAATLPGAHRAAHDFADASLLLAPGRAMTYMTRALVRIEQGDPVGARDDAQRVRGESPETADFLDTYVSLLFRPFGFSAGTAGLLPEASADERIVAQQPLEAIVRVIGVYATRLARVRSACLRLVDVAPDWLPPGTSFLLPGGPVELRNEKAQIIDEGEEGPETTEVEINEVLDTTGMSIPALMRSAHADWHALAWLCWAAGLDAVALPQALAPRPEFSAAVAMAVARHFRAADALATNGLRSLTSGVPGFMWEGLDIAAMPAQFAQMAKDEYLEVRSVLLWLTSAGNISPFQSDLRSL